jgi:hypothetical protein
MSFADEFQFTQQEVRRVLVGRHAALERSFDGLDAVGQFPSLPAQRLEGLRLRIRLLHDRKQELRHFAKPFENSHRLVRYRARNRTPVDESEPPSVLPARQRPRPARMRRPTIPLPGN